MERPPLVPDPFDTALSYRRRFAAYYGIAPSTIAITDAKTLLEGYVIGRQQLLPLNNIIAAGFPVQTLVSHVSTLFRVDMTTATLLIASHLGDPLPFLRELGTGDLEIDAFRARIISKRSDLETEANRNIHDVQALINEWAIIRSIDPVTIGSDVQYLGENCLLTPTLLGTNTAPRPEDLQVIMDNTKATFEVPLIVGQNPGQDPIIKLSNRRPLRRDSFKTKQIRYTSIYGLIVLSPDILPEKKLMMRFFYNLQTNNFTYHYDQQAAGQQDIKVYLAMAFPTLNLEGRPAETRTVMPSYEEEEQIVSGVQYSFIIQGVLMERTTLYELCRRWPVFFHYLYMNENRYSMPHARNPFIYFRFQQDNLPQTRIKANQIEMRNDLRVEVKATVRDRDLASPFINIFVYLMAWLQYFQTNRSILSYYSNILGKQLQPVVDTKEPHFQRRAQGSLRGQALAKSTRYPGLFSDDYDDIVPADRQPNVEERDGKMTLVCPSNWPNLRYKGPGVPICFPPDNDDVAKMMAQLGSAGNLVSLGVTRLSEFMTPRTGSGWVSTRTPMREITNQARQRQLVLTSSDNKGDPAGDIGIGYYGKIANNARTRLSSVYPEYSELQFYRLGTPKIANSLLYAVLASVDDQVLFSLHSNSIPSYLALVRKQLGKVRPQCCRQQLWDISNEQITQRLLDLDRPLDSKLYYRAIEEMFKINLLIFVRSAEEQNKEDYDIEIPRHYGFLTVQPDTERPTVVLLRRDFDSSQASSSPHYEPIVYFGNNWVMRTFGTDLSRHLAKIYQAWNQVWIYDGRVILENSLANWNPYRLFARPGRGLIGLAQLIDNYGKQRGLTLQYTDGMQITVFGPPRPPEELPSFAEVFPGTTGVEAGALAPVLSYDQLTNLLGDNPKAVTMVEGSIVGLWYNTLGLKSIVYLPIKPMVIATDHPLALLPVKDSPYLTYHYPRPNRISTKLDFKKMQVKLLSILQWLAAIKIRAVNDWLPKDWFTIAPGEYQLDDLPVSLPIVSSVTEAMAHLERYTKGLIVDLTPEPITPLRSPIVQPVINSAVGSLRVPMVATRTLTPTTRLAIRVSSHRLANVFLEYANRILIATNDRLREIPLYLSGSYHNYRDFRQDRGLVAIGEWQLRLRLSQTVGNPLVRQIPVKIVNGKIEDSAVLIQPIFYMMESRPLMIVNMRNISNLTTIPELRQQALHIAYQDRMKKQLPELPRFRNELGQVFYPYVDYYVSVDGILQLSNGDDRTHGNPNYLEVARMHLSDKSVHILAVLAL